MTLLRVGSTSGDKMSSPEIIMSPKYSNILQMARNFKANKNLSENNSNNSTEEKIIQESETTREVKNKNLIAKGATKKVIDLRKIKEDTECFNKKDAGYEVLQKLTINKNNPLNKINHQAQIKGSNNIKFKNLVNNSHISDSDSESSYHNEGKASDSVALHLKKEFIVQDIHDDLISHDFYGSKRVEPIDWTVCQENNKISASEISKPIAEGEKSKKLKKVRVGKNIDFFYVNYVQNSITTETNFDKSRNIKINNYTNEGEAFALNIQRNLKESGCGLIKVTEEAKEAFKGKKIENRLMDDLQLKFTGSITVSESQKGISDFTVDSKTIQKADNSEKLSSENDNKNSKQPGLVLKLLKSFREKNKEELKEFLNYKVKTLLDNNISNTENCISIDQESKASSSENLNKTSIHCETIAQDECTIEPKNIFREDTNSNPDYYYESEKNPEINLSDLNSACTENNENVSLNANEKLEESIQDSVFEEQPSSPNNMDESVENNENISLNSVEKLEESIQDSAFEEQPSSPNNINECVDDQNSEKLSEDVVETNNHSLAVVPKQDIIIEDQIQNDLTNDNFNIHRIIREGEDYTPSDEGFDIVFLEEFGLYKSLLMQSIEKYKASESLDDALTSSGEEIITELSSSNGNEETRSTISSHTNSSNSYDTAADKSSGD